MSRGKKYTASIAGIDRQHLYSASEAVDLVKASAKAKFDETVELAVRQSGDDGAPLVATHPDSPAAHVFMDIARRLL